MFPWLLYVLMCITGAAMYNVAVKVAGSHINPFVFTSGLTAVALIGHLACLGLYKYHLGENVNFQTDKTGMYMVLLAGIAVVIIDLCFYFALKTGSLVNTNLVWTIGATTLTALAGFFIFKEPFTATKMAGLAFGGIAIYLLTRP
jgi:drug/metabolite transporter (DMT)-like permease